MSHPIEKEEEGLKREETPWVDEAPLFLLLVSRKDNCACVFRFRREVPVDDAGSLRLDKKKEKTGNPAVANNRMREETVQMDYLFLA